jgi:hypothetical protein
MHQLRISSSSVDCFEKTAEILPGPPGLKKSLEDARTHKDSVKFSRVSFPFLFSAF